MKAVRLLAGSLAAAALLLLALLPWPRNRFEVSAHLRTLRSPVLLVVARRDRLVPYENARRLAASLPRPPQWIEEERQGHDGLLRAALADGRLQAFVRAAAGANR